ncbi:MAG: diguanylate cyclase, partial [Frankiales bacterium]|nr:diguanylate cyclase [Frankiales bacterium]
GEALTDPLTGLPNRRAWDDALARELALARQQGRPLTVALLDLDRFKAFNDSQGHPAGDALLVGATRLWRDRLRTGDLLARLGGEEFGVLLYNCSLADGAVLVERLLGDLPSDQTCSAGLAELGDETARELLTRADQALYRAKAGGRARLALADPVPVLVRRPGQSPASAVRASPSTR